MNANSRIFAVGCACGHTLSLRRHASSMSASTVPLGTTWQRERWLCCRRWSKAGASAAAAGSVDEGHKRVCVWMGGRRQGVGSPRVALARALSERCAKKRLEITPGAVPTVCATSYQGPESAQPARLCGACVQAQRQVHQNLPHMPQRGKRPPPPLGLQHGAPRAPWTETGSWCVSSTCPLHDGMLCIRTSHGKPLPGTAGAHRRHPARGLGLEPFFDSIARAATLQWNVMPDGLSRRHTGNNLAWSGRLPEKPPQTRRLNLAARSTSAST